MDESAKMDAEAGAAAEAAGEAGGAPEAEAVASGWKVGGESSATWLAQLQAMIDNIATQAGPTVRQVAAKAAELAAIAADRAGPIAQRAAAVTQDVSVKVAERSRKVAADLRHTTEQEQAAEQPAADAAPPEVPESPEP